MKVALLGLLESGKSTLFSAISGKAITPIGSTNIEEAIVPVPDERLDWLKELYQTKSVHATVDCLDVPGLNFLDDRGRAAAGRLFNQIRAVDLLVLIVRAFENPAVPSYKNRIDLDADLQELKNELLLADFELVATRIEKLEKQVNKPTKTQTHDKAELKLQKKLQQTIEAEKPIRSAIENDQQLELIKSLGFLTLKPILVVVNIGEDHVVEGYDMSRLALDDTPAFAICAELEYELAQLDTESKKEFMADMGISEPAINKFVNGCYDALGLISFLTVGSDEVRAWPIKKGICALDAAGKVHSDIKRGFIRAETFTYDDLKQLGNEKAVKAAGKARLEGKQYTVKDGDVIEFRFNV